MKIVQIIQNAYEAPISGADLRNNAILLSLRQLGAVSQFDVGHLSGALEPQSEDPVLLTIQAQAPDLIVVEGVGMLESAKALRVLCPKAHIVFDFHNVESSLLMQQDRARAPSCLRFLVPLLFSKRWRAAIHDDLEAISMADAIWLCTAQDQALASALAGRPVKTAVVPNACPRWCETANLAKTHFEAQYPTILYLGHLGYPPNKVSVRRLAKRIMPLIQTFLPKTQLIVAGRAPNTRLRSFLGRFEHVELIADPVEVHALYERADMVVLPLTEGGGSRIKVLEALAIGCPIVATAKAIEGLRLVPEKHFLLAEQPEEFATAVTRLVMEPELRETLRREGVAFAQTFHGAPAIDRAIFHAVASIGASSLSKPSA